MKQTYTLFNNAIITGDNLTGRKTNKTKSRNKTREWFFNKATSIVWTEENGTKTIEVLDPLENNEKRKIDMHSFTGFIVIPSKNSKGKDIIKTFKKGKIIKTDIIEGAYKNAVEMHKKIVKYLTMKIFYNMTTDQFIKLLSDNDLDLLDNMLCTKEKYNSLN